MLAAGRSPGASGGGSSVETYIFSGHWRDSGCGIEMSASGLVSPDEGGKSCQPGLESACPPALKRRWPSLELPVVWLVLFKFAASWPR